ALRDRAARDHRGDGDRVPGADRRHRLDELLAMVDLYRDRPHARDRRGDREGVHPPSRPAGAARSRTDAAGRRARIERRSSVAYNLRNRSYVKELDFTPDELKFLLRLSAEVKAAKYGGFEQPRLLGKNIA